MSERYVLVDYVPRTEFGRELERIVENGDNSDATIYWLVNRVEELESLLNSQLNIIGYYEELSYRYKQALEFYADEESYKTNVISQWEPIRPVMRDNGEKARQALKGE